MPANPDLAIASAAQCGGRKVVYRWTQFHGKEEVTEFDLDSHMELNGFFQSNSSSGHKEYQDRLRAIYLRKEGKTKADIAKALDRSERFVSKWWQLDTKEVPRPPGVHQYLTLDHTAPYAQGASSSENSAMDAATHWRDVELRRNYCNDELTQTVYQELLHGTDWGADVARTRDFRTGAQHLKYDKEGNIRMQGKQSGKYKHGISPALDRVLQKLFHEYGIEDRTSGIGVNWYPDGSGMLGSHRHDCWTALFSFGCDRILTIDKTPLLCRDGDLVIFGTQRHGVPLMAEVTEGRITVPVFFYPSHMQKQAMWKTIADDAEGMSSKAATLKNNAALANRSNSIGISAQHQNDLTQLIQMGFEASQAEEALLWHKFDVTAAAVLLSNTAAADRDLLDFDEETAKAKTPAHSFPASFAGCRWGKRAAAATNGASSSSMPDSCCVSTAAPSLSNELVDDDNDEASVALALQLEEEHAASCDGWCSGMPFPIAHEVSEDDATAAASIALALQLETEAQGLAMSPELLAAQFQQYEEGLDRTDAEEGFKSGMHGDLMASKRARENLTLENMEQSIVYSLGHGHMHERQFFELLQLHSIRVLYDLRGTDYRQELHRAGGFTVKFLKDTCKARNIFYKQMPIGREGAYGTLAHLKSKEAEHTLIELLWQAKRKPTAFLGRDVDWRHDPRLAIAEKLASQGHVVWHIDEVGSVEKHQLGTKIPDSLLTEEERLRTLEKQRKAGELKRPEKASDSRSTEAVAKALTIEKDDLDVGKELLECENQTQLKFAQQRLARLQRVADEKGVMFKGKQLTHVPKYVKTEAKEQAAWLSERKKIKELADGKKSAETEPNNLGSTGAGSAAAAASPELVSDADMLLLVECAVCKKELPWAQLSAGDGVCIACSASGGEETFHEDIQDLEVECIRCHEASLWSVLRLQDGVCLKCSGEQSEREKPEGAAKGEIARSGVEAAPIQTQHDSTRNSSSVALGTSEGSSSASASWRARRRLQQSPSITY